MIVRALTGTTNGDTAEIVTQIDHAVVSGLLAEAWGSPSVSALVPRDSVVLAAHMHDIGWRHWESKPRLNTETGRPTHFLDVAIKEHLRLYRLGLAQVEALDLYAGMLVSMHVAGIYTGRFGTQPSMKLTAASDAQQMVDAFVAEQKAHFSALRNALGVTEDELWRNYMLLQVFDRLSLRLCQGDPAGPGPVEIQLPDEAVLRVELADDGAETLSPWPFTTPTMTLEIPTRVIALDGYVDDAALGAALASAAVDLRPVTLRPAV